LILRGLDVLSPQVNDALAAMMRRMIGGQQDQFQSRHLACRGIEGLEQSLVLEPSQCRDAEIVGIVEHLDHRGLIEIGGLGDRIFLAGKSGKGERVGPGDVRHLLAEGSSHRGSV
jgi:hypothetical protein